jgi:hypothetical protein
MYLLNQPLSLEAGRNTLQNNEGIVISEMNEKHLAYFATLRRRTLETNSMMKLR